MTKFKFLSVAVLSCILFSSCLKSSFYYSGYVNFANVANETTLDADGGLTYNVTENTSSKSFKDLHRIFLNCDLLAAMDDNYTQDIKVNDFYEVKEMKAAVADAQTVTKRDSVQILYRSWTVNKNEAQYFNLYVQYTGLKGSKTEHQIELVYVPQTEESNTYYFYLYHDAADDLCDADTPQDDKQVTGYYVSFRVEEIIKEIKYDAYTKFMILPASDLKEASEKLPETEALRLRSRKAEL